MGRKCLVPECLSEEGREQDAGVTFHKIPLHEDIRPKWMTLCHIPDERFSIKVLHVCSRHFRKADFCNFKGKKYLLRHGVLPSVFPWNRLKRQESKNSPTIKTESDSPILDATPNDDRFPEDDQAIDIKEEPLDIGNEPIEENSTLSTAPDLSTVKNEPSQNYSTVEPGKSVQTSTGILTFGVNTRLEVLEFNQTWVPARVMEIDYEEDEALIHFDKSSSKSIEWISMSSTRLRSVQPTSKKNMPESPLFNKGENCLAVWNDGRKFPASIKSVIDADTYEVAFEDGLVKVLNVNKISKLKPKDGVSAAPLFDPVKGSKQDRRDKKRKLNVSDLFRKRSRGETGAIEEVIHSTDDAVTAWAPKWEQGRPIGTESTIETVEGQKKSVMIADPTLPPEWQKHLVPKDKGSIIKWETVILSPDGCTIRNKTEMKSYLEQNPLVKHSEKLFNFNIYKRSKGARRATQSSDSSPAVPVTPTEPVPEVKTSNSLEIPFVDDAYVCPIEGCGKSFRRVNLAQMHVKHYHPEYTKFLDCTPNVADLAYARTVGESLDKSPERLVKTPVRQTPKPGTPKGTTPRPTNNSPVTTEGSKPLALPSAEAKGKDTEIIKLLNKVPDEKLPKQVPSTSTYPDIKLKDLLSKSEGIPKRDDVNLKTLSTSRPTGIKTLLPVVRTTEVKKESKTDEMDQENSLIKQSSKSHLHKHLKRKRQVSDIIDTTWKESVKDLPAQEPPKEHLQNPDFIVEGGEVIKIVRMKREEIINCTCGITEEDGLMIQCEVCLCWQHAYCNNIERENQVPEKYICYICQNPARQRASRKYFHDQDWLKCGTLPVANYHCKDGEALKKRFEKLKKIHDSSGGLLELKNYLNSLSVKLKIAKTKNHPKLYLWSKPWDKPVLPEKDEAKTEGEMSKTSTGDIPLLGDDILNKNNLDLSEKTEPASMLLSMLKSNEEDFKSLTKLDFNSLDDEPVSSAPQPEAAIESADCVINLLDHIAHSQNLVEERLNNIEEQLDVLDSENVNTDEEYKRTCQTIQMVLKDLGYLKELCCSNIL